MAKKQPVETETMTEVVEIMNENVSNDAEQAETPNSVENTEAQVAIEVDETLEMFKSGLTDLNVDQLKSVITHCEELIEEKQRDQVAELERQMREIQDKLWAMKGGKYFNEQRPSTSTTKKAGRPIHNPSNPSEVYSGFGARPNWLTELLVPAGGDKLKEREMLDKLRNEQSTK